MRTWGGEPRPARLYRCPHNASCALCRYAPETGMHIFVQCRFTKRICADISNWLLSAEIHPNNWGTTFRFSHICWEASVIYVGRKGQEAKNDRDFERRTVLFPSFLRSVSVTGTKLCCIFERVESPFTSIQTYCNCTLAAIDRFFFS